MIVKGYKIDLLVDTNKNTQTSNLA